MSLTIILSRPSCQGKGDEVSKRRKVIPIHKSYTNYENQFLLAYFPFISAWQTPLKDLLAREIIEHTFILTTKTGAQPQTPRTNPNSS